MKRRKPVPNTNIPKHASLSATRHLSYTAKNVVKKLTLCTEYKVLCLGKTQHNITDYHSSYFQALWCLHHGMGMLVIGKD
jgi:hypothetical protein